MSSRLGVWVNHVEQPLINGAADLNRANQKNETEKKTKKNSEVNEKIRKKNEIAQSEPWMLHRRHGNIEKCMGYQSYCLRRDVDGPLCRSG